MGTIPLFLAPMVLACLALGVAVVVLELVVVLPHVAVVVFTFMFVVIYLISLRFFRLLEFLLLSIERLRRVISLCASPPLVSVQK